MRTLNSTRSASGFRFLNNRKAWLIVSFLLLVRLGAEACTGTTPAPNTTILLQSNGCGTATLYYTGTPPSGITWYWQTSATGTSTAHSGTTFTVTAGGTYYLRAGVAGNCWSTDTPPSFLITINTTTPACPSATLSVGNTCGTATLSYTGTPPSGVTWYWQTSSSGQSFSYPGSPVTVPTSGTWYLVAYKGGCWSPSNCTGGGGGGEEMKSGDDLKSNEESLVMSPMGLTPPPNISVTIHPLPTVFTLSGGGTRCASEGGKTITLSTTQTGINYQLKVNATNAGAAVAGTGSSISWTNQTAAGTYTVVATNTTTSCTAIMTGSVTITVNANPVAYAVGGGGYACADAGVSVTLADSEPGVAYILHKNATTVTSLNGTGSALAFTNILAEGTYTITASNLTTECVATMTGSVAVFAPPGAPSTPDITMCAVSTVTVTGTPGTNGVTLNWYDWYDSETWHLIGTGTSLAITNPPPVVFAKSVGATGCVSSGYDSVIITLVPRPQTFMTNDGDGMLGYGAPVALSTIAPPGQVVHWYVDNDPATTPFQTGSPTTPVSVLSTTVFYAALYDPATLCETERWPYTVTVPPLISTPANITKDVVRTPGKLTYNDVTLAATTEKFTNKMFIDGLSRPFQVQSFHAVPGGGKDIVSPAEYDANGRPVKNYLPYAALSNAGNYYQTATTDQVAYYRISTDKVADEVAGDANPNAWAASSYEASPLGRVLEQGAPGTAWQPGSGHTGRAAYSYNVANEVRQFNADGTSSQFYAANTLTRITTTTPDGINTVTYSKSGLTVLSKTQVDQTIDGVLVDYLETYSIYDDFGRPLLVIQPRGVAALKLNSWSLTQTIKDQYVFEMVYDKRGRLTQKKVPGSGWTYLVYDQLNRPVMSQDNNIRAAHQWKFIKYDIRNRPVISGLYTDASHLTLASMQGVLDAFNYGGSDKFYEIRQASTSHGYSNGVFPTTGTTILSVNYYDDYDFDFNNVADYSYTTAGISGENSPGRSFGLATGSKSQGPGGWLLTYVFYDKYHRPIQTRSNNHLNYTPTNLSTVAYDFEGKAIVSKKYHDAGGTHQTTTVMRPVYDSYTGAVKQMFTTINGGTEFMVAQYDYNELGQLVDKKLHSTDNGSTFLQSVDFRYNIRGWLTSINNAQLSSDGGATNDDTNDLFGMEFLFNAVDAGMSNTVRYDGSISAVKWKGAGQVSGATGQRGFTYTYDKPGRLSAASYKARGTSAWDQEAGLYNESFSYDHNGNLKTLQRSQNLRALSGTTVTSAQTTIDSLTYTYAAGNQLSKVEDASAVSAGFSNGATATTEYTYDTQGNVSTDLNKGISGLTYNYLGKPTQINFSDGKAITYDYDAQGNKVTMKNYVGGTLQTTTDYAGGFVYENNELTFFAAPEGRVVNNAGTLEYQYAIGDQQGNTRVVFSSVTPTAAPEVATFEGDGSDASSTFENVSQVVSFVAANHTAGGTKVVRLNQGNPVGPSKSLKVFPGDKIDVSVWTYFENNSGYGTSSPSASAMITAIAGAFGGVSGGGEASGSIFSGVNSAIGGFGLGGNKGDAAPAAYLNYILFDQGYKVMDMGWTAVPAAAYATKQQITIPQITAKEAGFIFVYLSYEDESNNYVEFDDLSITHTKTNVVQYNEYYPFGLQTQRSWTRENSKNNFLGNGGSELNATTGWYDTYYRGYDPAIGRFHQVDPLATSSANYTPYHFAANNPVMFSDPGGDHLIQHEEGWMPGPPQAGQGGGGDTPWAIQAMANGAMAAADSWYSDGRTWDAQVMDDIYSGDFSGGTTYYGSEAAEAALGYSVGIVIVNSKGQPIMVIESERFQMTIKIEEEIPQLGQVSKLPIFDPENGEPIVISGLDTFFSNGEGNNADANIFSISINGVAGLVAVGVSLDIVQFNTGSDKGNTYLYGTMVMPNTDWVIPASGVGWAGGIGVGTGNIDFNENSGQRFSHETLYGKSDQVQVGYGPASVQYQWSNATDGTAVTSSSLFSVGAGFGGLGWFHTITYPLFGGKPLGLIEK